MSTNPVGSVASGVPKKPRKSRRRAPIQRRKLAGVTITVQHRRIGKHTARVVVHAGGKTTTKGFATMEEAKAYAQTQEIEAANTGARAATEIGHRERRTLLHAKEALAAHGKTIDDAVAFYLAHLTTESRSASIASLIADLRTHHERERKSSRYLTDLKSRLGRFSREFGERPAASFTSEEISAWLAGLDFNAVGTNNTRRALAVLFNYAASRRLCPEGIMRKTVRMKTVEREPGILTVAECNALLLAAPDSIRAGIALALFTGIRDAELQRLDWRAVDLDAESLVIGAGIAKLGQRRIVPIRPNLKAWLEPLRQLGGPVMPSIHLARPILDQTRKAAGFGVKDASGELRQWPHNALRHSYASYCLAQWPDAAALALEMGNSPAVILRHYRQLVKPAAAEAFWNLTPHLAAAANVVMIEKKPTPRATKRTKTA